MLFDTFRTVVDWRGVIIREVSAFFSRHGIDSDAEQFADDWRQRYQPAMERIRSGERSFVRLDVLHLEHLRDRLRNAGLVQGPFTDEKLLALNLDCHRLEPWPERV